MKHIVRCVAITVLLAVSAHFHGADGGLALDTVPLQYMEVLEPAYFFRAGNSDSRLEFSGDATATIQGIRVSFRKPKDLDVAFKEVSGMNIVTFRKGDSVILECAVKPRNPQHQTPDGEPFNTMKKVAQVELLKNIIIRGAARDSGDRENLLPNIPVVTLEQNTRNTFILAARNQAYERGDTEKGGMDSVFEGYILLGRSCLPISVAGHKNPYGIEAGDLFFAWLNDLVDNNQ